MLKYAWKFEQEDMEIKAYSEISLCFFYRQDLDNANYFYNKSWKSSISNKFSSIKNLGIKKADENIRYHLEHDKDDTVIMDELNLEM